MYALINQLTLVCNMQWNVLDDLAEALKALDGKKWEKRVNTEEVHTLVSSITTFSEAWIGFNELPPAPNATVDTDI